MNRNVLFVDDDKNILSSFKRTLQKKYNVHTANSPEEGLEMLKNPSIQFSVIVSDFKMPNMNGVEFLSKAAALRKNTVRILLTGYADLETAMKAVNEGNIYKFLTKPIDSNTIVHILDSAIELYRLTMAEKELIKGTLQGSMKMLTDIMALVSPETFGETERLKQKVSKIVKLLKIKNGWQIEIASLLCELGFIAIPPDIIKKVNSGNELTDKEKDIYKDHTLISSKLIKNIPRLNNVAELIEAYEYSPKEKSAAPLGSRIIRIVRDFNRKLNMGEKKSKIIHMMRQMKDIYDENLIDILEKITSESEGAILKMLNIADLKEGMILNQDIETSDRILLLKKGQYLSESSIIRLNSYGKSVGIEEPLEVIITTM